MIDRLLTGNEQLPYCRLGSDAGCEHDLGPRVRRHFLEEIIEHREVRRMRGTQLRRLPTEKVCALEQFFARDCRAPLCAARLRDCLDRALGRHLLPEAELQEVLP